jgi:hypothetical protein
MAIGVSTEHGARSGEFTKATFATGENMGAFILQKVSVEGHFGE